MPNIKPISNLRDYNAVLKEVDENSRVYLTRNGHGAYAIMTMEEADMLDRIKAAHFVAADLKRADNRAEKEGWISEEQLHKAMEG